MLLSGAHSLSEKSMLTKIHIIIEHIRITEKARLIKSRVLDIMFLVIQIADGNL